MRRRDDEFAEFAVVAARRMCRTAYLMCGDWHRAEDATQDALVKVYRRWRHLRKDGGLASYANRAVVSAVLDQSRRKWRSEILGGLESVVLAAPDAMTVVDTRAVVVQALSRLPPGQRACVVLRYYADFSIEQTAEILGTGAGSVKSQTSRGLAELRSLLALPERNSA
ncbi:SigE family RNA polymerase sigma factor [Kribbella albertanoniae]|uniref:SigE family RNA polymerase sigma factor n=1 Tax=Kribbella albertanoniae TaxID=1266829 RepID=A0A4R4Q724_9ACTN|nr:SigE family RNA polymerase sigma factor [Kribbella albertanoniae]TDC30977.1 SigE family RNA polymerase sigma factor [Kribbella albertanoniae]